jgi:hypothetical protein
VKIPLPGTGISNVFCALNLAHFGSGFGVQVLACSDRRRAKVEMLAARLASLEFVYMFLALTLGSAAPKQRNPGLSDETSLRFSESQGKRAGIRPAVPCTDARARRHPPAKAALILVLFSCGSFCIPRGMSNNFLLHFIQEQE